MVEKMVNSWQELQNYLDEIENRYGHLMYGKEKHPNRILYRGQTDASWGLKTTLERNSTQKWSLGLYANLAWFCHSQIVAHTGKRFQLPGKRTDFQNDLENKMQDLQNLHFSISVPYYEYWAYLRHHGFPSPLLDWSSSPYVAVFFAISDRSESENAAVYVFIEHTGEGKSHFGNTPMISVLGPYVETHSRHFLQQSDYTIATQKAADGKDYNIVSYDEFYNSTIQDLILKIVIPRSLRKAILKKLEQYNINYFSLMHTEDALMKHLTIKEIDLSGLD
jgi:hypothetical protein